MSSSAPEGESVGRRGSAARALTPGARCARHGERGATGVCHRCGDYLCGLCAKRSEGRLSCEVCAERLTRGHGARAARALVLGLLGVHGLFFLSPVAAVLGAIELRAIRDGDSPVGGRGPARAALALGICGVLMPVSILIVVFSGG